LKTLWEKSGDAIQYISPKNLLGKPKYFQYTRQNSLKSSGKNKEKHHNIQLPMLVDP